MSLRLMATCPKNLSRPTRDLCITMRKRMYFSGFPCISKPGSSKEASSFQTGSRVFSATDVEYFSLPSWIIVYVSLVPLLPFGLRSLAWSTVTCTWVGNHFWACSESIILSFFSAPSSPAQAGPLPQGEPDSLNHCILRTLNGDRQTHSCPTSLRLMSKRLAGAAWGHSCSGGPLSSGEAQGPTITWPRSPGLRTSTLRRPRGLALGGDWWLPGLRAGEARPPRPERRAAEVGGRPRPNSQPRAFRPPPPRLPPARRWSAGPAGLLLPTPVIRTAGGSCGLAPSRKPLPPPPPRLGSSSRAGLGAGAGRCWVEWDRGRGTLQLRRGRTAGWAAGGRTAGAGLGLAEPAAPSTRRAAALPGCPSPSWSRECDGAGQGRAGPGVKGQHLPGCRGDRGRVARAVRPRARRPVLEVPRAAGFWGQRETAPRGGSQGPGHARSWERPSFNLWKLSLLYRGCPVPGTERAVDEWWWNKSVPLTGWKHTFPQPLIHSSLFETREGC